MRGCDSDQSPEWPPGRRPEASYSGATACPRGWQTATSRSAWTTCSHYATSLTSSPLPICPRGSDAIELRSV